MANSYPKSVLKVAPADIPGRGPSRRVPAPRRAPGRPARVTPRRSVPTHPRRATPHGMPWAKPVPRYEPGDVLKPARRFMVPNWVGTSLKVLEYVWQLNEMLHNRGLFSRTPGYNWSVVAECTDPTGYLMGGGSSYCGPLTVGDANIGSGPVWAGGFAWGINSYREVPENVTHPYALGTMYGMWYDPPGAIVGETVPEAPYAVRFPYYKPMENPWPFTVRPDLRPIGKPMQFPKDRPWYVRMEATPQPLAAPRPVAKPNVNPKPPGPGVRERKTFILAMPPGFISRLINAVTETNDFINAVYMALPWELRKKRWDPVDERWEHVSPAEKVWRIWQHYEDLDMPQVMVNILLENNGDFIFGRYGRFTAAQNRLNNRPAGLAVGPAI